MIQVVYAHSSSWDFAPVQSAWHEKTHIVGDVGLFVSVARRGIEPLFPG